MVSIFLYANDVWVFSHNVTQWVASFFLNRAKDKTPQVAKGAIAEANKQIAITGRSINKELCVGH